MLRDALLAWFHYLSIFLLVAAQAAQAVLLRPGLSANGVRRLAFYDRIYGLSAVAVLASGVLRLTLGAKGVAFYMHNPWFHAKIAVYVLIALCSIMPTIAFLRWSKAARQAGHVPDDAAIRGARRWVLAETHLLVLLPLFAALMARGYGM